MEKRIKVSYIASQEPLQHIVLCLVHQAHISDQDEAPVTSAAQSPSDACLLKIG